MRWRSEHNSKDLLPTLLTNIEKGISKNSTDDDRRIAVSYPETKRSIMFNLFHTKTMALPLLCVVWSSDLRCMYSSLMICKLWNRFFLIPSFRFASWFQSCDCTVLAAMSGLGLLRATAVSVWCAFILCPCFCVHVSYHKTSKFIPGWAFPDVDWRFAVFWNVKPCGFRDRVFRNIVAYLRDSMASRLRIQLAVLCSTLLSVYFDFVDNVFHQLNALVVKTLNYSKNVW
jgi:hypothetical protein